MVLKQLIMMNKRVIKIKTEALLKWLLLISTSALAPVSKVEGGQKSKVIKIP